MDSYFDKIIQPHQLSNYVKSLILLQVAVPSVREGIAINNNVTISFLEYNIQSDSAKKSLIFCVAACFPKLFSLTYLSISTVTL